jgi:peptidoglycan/LPS O-acetylase OafA/YrhL
MSGDRYLNNLTPLRGIAALWVAAFHFYTLTSSLFKDQQFLLLKKGYLMVDLFFIMSGFIIRHVYWDQFKDGIARKALRQFIVARFARIYPLHFFTLVFLVLIAFVSNQWNGLNDPAAIAIHILLLQSFGIINHHTWNVPSWSLSAEWSAYMLFPVLVLFLSRKSRFRILVLLTFIVIGYLAVVFWLPTRDIDRLAGGSLHNLDVTFDYGFLRGVSGFASGMLVYGLYCQSRVRRFFSRDWLGLVFATIILLVMYENWNDLLLLPAFWGLTLCFASNCGYVHQICSKKAPQFVGKVSYSIYLLQRIVLIYFSALIPSSDQGIIPFYQKILFLSGYLVLLVGIAAITYYGIENPCRYYINRKYRTVGTAGG